MADLTSAGSYFATYDNSGTGTSKIGENLAGKKGNGLGPKTHIITMGVGGGAISQAQLDGFIRGITQGASLQNNDLTPDAFTVAGIESAFTAASSTSVDIAVQGTGTPSTTTGEYFAACTVAIVATFDQNPA